MAMFSLIRRAVAMSLLVGWLLSVAAVPALARSVDLDDGFGDHGYVVQVSSGGPSSIGSLPEPVVLSSGKLLVYSVERQNGRHRKIVRLNQDGSVDETWDAELSPIDFGRIVPTTHGELMVVGRIPNGINFDWALTRFTHTGSVDHTFGGGDGWLPLGIAWNSPAIAQHIGGGRIQFITSSDTGAGTHPIVVRVAADGQLDAGFGAGGIKDVVINDPVGAGGRIAGSASSGYVITAHDTAWVKRIDPNGDAIAGFGAGGECSVTGIGTVGREIDDAALLDGDRVALLGYYWNEPLAGRPGRRKAFVARVLPDCSLDPDFGDGGIATLPVDASGDLEGHVLAAAAGKLLVAVNDVVDGNGEALTVMRLDERGQPDGSFAEGGRMSLASHFFENFQTVLQPDGKLLVATHTLNGSGRLLVRFRIDSSDMAASGSSRGSGTRRNVQVLVRNRGPRWAKSVTVAATVPAHIQVIRATIPHGSCSVARISQGRHRVRCRVAQLRPGARVRISLVVRGRVTHNTAIVARVASHVPDARHHNNRTRILLR